MDISYFMDDILLFVSFVNWHLTFLLEHSEQLAVSVASHCIGFSGARGTNGLADPLSPFALDKHHSLDPCAAADTPSLGLEYLLNPERCLGRKCYLAQRGLSAALLRHLERWIRSRRTD